MKIEVLEDLLKIDTDSMKSADKSRLLTRVKQLLKLENKVEAKTDEEALNLPYEGVGVVDNKLVSLRFDIDSKKARVTDIEEDSRAPVIGALALQKLKVLVRTQREIKKEVISE